MALVPSGSFGPRRAQRGGFHALRAELVWHYCVQTHDPPALPARLACALEGQTSRETSFGHSARQSQMARKVRLEDRLGQPVSTGPSQDLGEIGCKFVGAEGRGHRQWRAHPLCRRRYSGSFPVGRAGAVAVDATTEFEGSLLVERVAFIAGSPEVVYAVLPGRHSGVDGGAPQDHFASSHR